MNEHNFSLGVFLAISTLAIAKPVILGVMKVGSVISSIVK
jgi:hypothetical protein